MKQLLLSIICLSVATLSFSQDEEPAEEAKNWTTAAQIQINFSQLALINWAAGGENTLSGFFIGGGTANFKKNKHAWDNKLDINYGAIWTKGDGLRKSDDRVEVNSKYGYQIADKWYASSLLNFRSQFFEGFKFFDDGTKDLVSKAFAPAYLQLGVGVEYKPSDIFSLYLSPATGKFTFVSANDSINETDYGVEAGKTARAEFGAMLAANFKKEILKNVTLGSQLQLFNAYEEHVDVDWQTNINMKVNEYITVTIFTHLIYDEDQRITLTNDEGNAIKIPDPDNPGMMIDKKGIRTQFKEAFGVGFSYKL